MGSIRHTVAILWLVLASTVAGAAPLRSMPDLVSITFYEQTGTLRSYTFGVASPEMTVRLPDPLTASTNDFAGASLEYFDVFYSDADGRFNLDGEYVTVEGVYGRTAPSGGGLNLCEVQLDFGIGSSQFGCFIASFLALGDNASPASAPRAADGDVTTWCSLGNTVNQTERLRVTVGFCSAGNRMTGGGVTLAATGERVTWGFDLHCSPLDGPNRLEVNSEGNRFHLTALDSAACANDPGIDPGQPRAEFDRLIGRGTGAWNGEPGATARWTFTDAGEPGRDDTVSIEIQVGGTTVLSASGPLQGGNHQAH